MKDYRWHAAVVLLIILTRVHVTILPGWTVPAIPLLLVSGFAAMAALLWGVLRQGSRPAIWQRVPPPAGA